MFRSLEYYTIFAERLIRAYNQRYNKHVNPTDEMVGYVAHRLMKAEEKYKYALVSDKCKSGKTEDQCRTHYLRMWGIFGIRAYISNINKRKFRPILSTDMQDDLEYDFLNQFYVSNRQKYPEDNINNGEVAEEKKNLINVLLNSSNLTPKQKHAVEEHVFKKKSFEKIASELDPPVTAQAVSYAYQSAIAKMRSMVKGVNTIG